MRRLEDPVIYSADHTPRGCRKTDRLIVRKSAAAPLHDACWHDDATKVKRLLKRGTSASVRELAEEKQGAHVAAESNATRALAMLLEAGADPNAATLAGYRPLHYCCISDSVDCLRMLLDYGANPLAADNRGLTPLDHARLLDAHRCLHAMKYRGSSSAPPKKRRPDLQRRGPELRKTRTTTTTRMRVPHYHVAPSVYQAHLNGAPLA